MFQFVIFVSVLAYTIGGLIPDGLVPMLDGRIVGGKDTTVEEFPHQVSLRYYGGHRCGGSVYSKNIIVSAAHCVYKISSKSLSIVAGSTYLSEPIVTVPVKAVVYHENFQPTTMDNDISIIVLRVPLKFGDSIQPIPLQKDEVKVGAIAFVSGWGALSEGGNSPDVLQYVEISTFGSEMCAKKYRSVGAKITKAMLCAGNENGGRDACQGDSGGPLISSGKLIGVVSWGFGCARPEYPGVYTKISTLFEWVEKKTKPYLIE